MSTRTTSLVPLFALALAGCGRADGATVLAQEPRQEPRPVLGTSTDVQPLPPDSAMAVRLSSTFRAAASRALPAVVYVAVESQPQTARSVDPSQRFFFGPAQPEQEPSSGSGSGFIISEEGYIVTNNHVIDGATTIGVRLQDGREYDAELMGTDPNTDLAVLKIDPEPGANLPVVNWGDSDSLAVGDWVLVLGSPLDLQFTVTAGIVSAMSRSIGIIGRGRGEAAANALESFIQTDAAINRGNSGGPMVDLQGRVVGVNSAISGPQFLGYGFAIPSRLVQRVTEDLIRDGVVHRPQIGVLIGAIDAVDAEVYGLGRVMGAEITQVNRGTPAERAGLRMGDVVLTVDGREIENNVELLAIIARYRPGDRVTLGIVRDRQRREVTVTLGEFQTEQAAQPRFTSNSDRAEDLLDFRVGRLDQRIADQLQVRDTEGVWVVDATGAARNAGIVPGLRIVSINRQPVSSAADVERIAERASPGEALSVVVEVPGPDPVQRVINYRIRR